MKKALISAIIALAIVIPAGVVWAVNANPAPGSLWTWLGPTFGADWAPPPFPRNSCGTIIVGTDLVPNYFGPCPIMIVGQQDGSNNSLIGEVFNSTPPGTFVLPAGTTGFGRTLTQGNTSFGVYGVSELFPAGGGVAVGAEFTARNFTGQSPNVSIPPVPAIGTTGIYAIGTNITCGTEHTPVQTKDCSIGLNISNESGNFTDPIFNTAALLSLYRQYGLFVVAQPSGNQTSAVLQNNGNGINLQLQTTTPIQPLNTVITAVDNTGTSRFSVQQNGDIHFTGHLVPNGTHGTTVNSCGTSPALGAGSNDTRGVVTTGTGAVTVCTVAFGVGFTVPPYCVLTPGAGGTGVPYINNATSTTLQIGFSGSSPGTNVYYHCDN